MAALRKQPHDGVKPAKFRIAVLARTKSSLIPIADALRTAGIGFRAIDLVPLRERPEVLDALSLARALLNPTDRTAWLGVLRAPWAGLSLEDLHSITSGDDAETMAAPIPLLLASRIPLLHSEGRLSEQGYAAATRVARVLREVAATRASAADSALGSWLESVWKALGGEDTVTREQRENLRLLWTVLDRLPEGELDLMGPGLHLALDALFAQPDPEAGSDFGVQLMTIHRSKGLEFEVVIVPDLEAGARTADKSLMSWLERGLADEDFADDGELTEFLIAPIQTKGAESGAARKWVESVKRERATQELRRLFYVAATRAREELHLFARLVYKESLKADGHLHHDLIKPDGLLKTAWPAFGEEIELRFREWLESRVYTESSEAEGAVETIAASVHEMPAPSGSALLSGASAHPALLHRLPTNYIAPGFPRRISSSHTDAPDETDGGMDDGMDDSDASSRLYQRTEGGLHSRLEGTAIHALLERLSRLRQSVPPEQAAFALAKALPAAIADLRSHGLPQATARSLAESALRVAQRASIDPTGAWILAPHAGAGAEARWTGIVGSGAERRQWNLRPDRVFFAPPPAKMHSSQEATPAAQVPSWWIIDYKTSHAPASTLLDPQRRSAFLRERREQYRGQLAAYAQVLRSLNAPETTELAMPAAMPIRAAIYYPRLLLFDYWEA